MADIKRITGFSLTEVLVVLAIAALLAGLGIPAAKEIFNTFESSAGVKSVINAALRNARAIAIKDGKYAGVRFQQDVDGRQYLIFVVNDPKPYVSDGDLAIDPTLTGTGIANGFRAIEGLKPIKLPKSVGLMDLRIRLDYGDPAVSTDEPIEDVSSVDESNLNIDDDEEVTDTTTFSIVFSPAGKLVTHNVRVKNKHGQWDQTVDSFPDDIFNIMEKVDAGEHELKLSAFDNMNNQAESQISFRISTTSELSIDQVVNYPNPFKTNTDFTFQTNREGAQAKIKIYTVSGRLIQELESYYSTLGYNQIPWDGRDRDGDNLANGVYLYKIILSLDNKKVETIDKMVVIN